MTRLRILFDLAAGAVLASACGSSDDTTNSPTGGAGGSDAGAEASAGSGGTGGGANGEATSVAPTVGTNAWENNIAFGADPEMNSPDSFPAPPNKVDTDPKLADVAGGNSVTPAPFVGRERLAVLPPQEP